MEPGSRPRPHYLERSGRRVGYEERERGVGDLVVRGGMAEDKCDYADGFWKSSSSIPPHPSEPSLQRGEKIREELSVAEEKVSKLTWKLRTSKLLLYIQTHVYAHMARSWRRLKVFLQLATVVN